MATAPPQATVGASHPDAPPAASSADADGSAAAPLTIAASSRRYLEAIDHKIAVYRERAPERPAGRTVTP
jgi:proteasome lid subunit RPN8/RPN11